MAGDLEPKARPIPITILDFLGVLIPGCVWVWLLVTTGALITKGRAVTPMEVLLDAFKATSGNPSWTAVATLIAASIIVGFAGKAGSTTLAEQFCRRLGLAPYDRPDASGSPEKFPFLATTSERKYLGQVRDIIRELTGVPYDELPGVNTFSAAKRCLRLLAYSLWEEIERLEAEVRFHGALLLASCYSVTLSVVAIIAAATRGGSIVDSIVWFVGSIAVAFILANGTGRLRLREVEYAYLNLIVAYGIQKRNYLTAAGSPPPPRSAG